MAVKVLIAIQARSSSTRFPGKAFATINGQPMISCVLRTCKAAARHLTDTLGIPTHAAILIPTGDRLKQALDDIQIIEGPELDVLERYRLAVDLLNPGFIVRITGDCPGIKSFIITRLVTLAITNDYDYVANVDERFRTMIDGHDCEVISRRLFEHTASTATDAYDREHVTTMMRRSPPEWARSAHALTLEDLSGIKTSVDTPEDLVVARQMLEMAEEKKRQATLHFGRKAVHVI